MSNYNEIPTLDLSGLLNSTQEDLVRLAQQVKEIYTTVGFAYVVNHGIPESIIENVFAQSKQFHALEEDEKIKIKQNQFFRGYMPNSASNFAISTLGTAKRSNNSSAFILGFDASERDADYIGQVNLAGPNQWPSEIILPDFKNALLTYRSLLSALSQRIVRVFSLAFGLSLDGLDSLFINPTTFLRLQYYPQQEQSTEQEQYGIAPHTDYGFITLLAQDQVGGLQVKSPDEDSWIDVPYRKGSFILNSGDMLKHMTSGVFLSTPHRVINPTGSERYSVPFFYEPSMHAVISPLPQFSSNPEVAPADSIEYCTHLMKRIKNNYKIGAQ